MASVKYGYIREARCNFAFVVQYRLHSRYRLDLGLILEKILNKISEDRSTELVMDVDSTDWPYMKALKFYPITEYGKDIQS